MAWSSVAEFIDSSGSAVQNWRKKMVGLKEGLMAAC